MYPLGSSDRVSVVSAKLQFQCGAEQCVEKRLLYQSYGFQLDDAFFIIQKSILNQFDASTTSDIDFYFLQRIFPDKLSKQG